MTETVWEDREIRFDVPNIQKNLRGGEVILLYLDAIEDSKGNPGYTGRLLISNLRMIWYSLATSKFTLSIGFRCVLTMNTRTALSNLRGVTQALYILTILNGTRFEFIFTNMSTAERSFAGIFEIYQLYKSSQLYRDLKLRGAIVTAGKAILLDKEQVFNSIGGVWNLSTNSGNLGTFVFTNVRMIWFADVNEAFNISLPYMQISNISIRESKYGPALVVATLETSGNYVLGFRIDPPDRLGDVYKEMKSLFAIYSKTPVFGVFYNADKTQPVTNEEWSIDHIEEIDVTAINQTDSNLNAYLFNGEIQEGYREPFYCTELGFAMEKLKDDGFKLNELWEVIPSYV